MMYFADMDDKFGFSDGDALPVGIWQFRTVYITVLNKLLEKFNSACRILPFDRVFTILVCGFVFR